MSEIPSRLEEYIHRAEHEAYPATLAETMHDYAAAALERPDRGVVVEDFRAREGVYLMTRRFNTDRKGGLPDGMHVVPVYGSDISGTEHYGPDFYALLDDPLTYNPDGVSFSQFLASRMKQDAGQRKVYDSQMQTMNMIRASRGEKPLTEEEFDSQLCPIENPFGRKYLSVGLVADMMKNSDDPANVNRIWQNADPLYVGLLLTSAHSEAHEASPGSLGTLREELMEGLHRFKQHAPEEFADYWKQVQQLTPIIPRLNSQKNENQSYTLPSIA